MLLGPGPGVYTGGRRWDQRCPGTSTEQIKKGRNGSFAQRALGWGWQQADVGAWQRSAFGQAQEA